MSIGATVIVMLKEPLPGRVKTRLAQGIGEAAALRIYERLLRITAEALQECPAEVLVMVAGTRFPKEAFPLEPCTWAFQEGDDLGARMQQAFRTAFARGADRALIIGTDLPGLSKALVLEALEALEKHPAVLGPTVDGGYYLLGLHDPMPPVFHEMPWSTDQVAQRTRERLRAQDLDWHELAVQRDLDTPEDLRYFLAGRPEGQAFAKENIGE